MTAPLRAYTSLSAWVLQPVVVAVILVVGFAAASRLSLRREPPQRSESAVYAPLVRTTPVESRTFPVAVHGDGSLEARTRIDLVPQVGGEVVAIHPELRAGGHFRAGEVLLMIEPRDYELAVARAEAEVTSAETAVVTTRAESEAAIAEWDQLHPGEPAPPLVRLEPQIREAEARVLTAQVALQAAELDLSRTRLALPFDGRVVAASVDVGEVVAANQSLGVVYATDVFEVAVPLRVEELAWIALPDGARDGDGAPATVRGKGAGGPFEVRGRVARLYGELDAVSRLARVVVEIPLADLDARTAARLVPGTFVAVELEGATLEGAVELPRAALREDGVVWVVEDGRLRFARPEILYRGNGTVLVEGLEPGARVVTSNLEVVTDGMQVRLFGEGEGDR